MSILIPFIIGYLLCAIHAYLEHRAQERRYNVLQDDCRKLVNEHSIRTGGRVVYKPEQVERPPTQAKGNKGEFSIMLPSMLEESDIDDEFPTMSAEDLEHLRKTGAVR